jgi:hypothetical protein
MLEDIKIPDQIPPGRWRLARTLELRTGVSVGQAVFAALALEDHAAYLAAANAIDDDGLAAGADQI